MDLGILPKLTGVSLERNNQRMGEGEKLVGVTEGEVVAAGEKFTKRM